MIHTEGEHEIRGGPAEVGRIKYVPHFIPAAHGAPDAIPFLCLVKSAQLAQPRLVAWYGDFGYRYSGLTLAPVYGDFDIFICNALFCPSLQLV